MEIQPGAQRSPFAFRQAPDRFFYRLQAGSHTFRRSRLPTGGKARPIARFSMAGHGPTTGFVNGTVFGIGANPAPRNPYGPPRALYEGM